MHIAERVGKSGQVSWSFSSPLSNLSLRPRCFGVKNGWPNARKKGIVGHLFLNELDLVSCQTSVASGEQTL